RAAARDGRLRVQFSTRSVFGRPIRLASRAAIDEFVRLHYRQRYSRYATPLPRPNVTVVPTNFASRLIGLRLRLHLTQAELARRVGVIRTVGVTPERAATSRAGRKNLSPSVIVCTRSTARE